LPRSDWINEYSCHLTRTIGQLMGDEGGDLWWSLEDETSQDVAGAALRDWDFRGSTSFLTRRP
jgi:hypothetical protein